MQRKIQLLACIFIWVNSIAQPTDTGGKYPFVYYTPKDGLISNSIRTIYQDSKGRLYFTSANGLSVYDGSRFTNYNSKNGLDIDIVNCVMQMAEDSVWIVTNGGNLKCLVDGKIKPVNILDSSQPVINYLCRNAKGNLYAASEQGLYQFQHNRFNKLPLVDLHGHDINKVIAYILPVGPYLFIQRDYSLLSIQKNALYLYDTRSARVTAEIESIYAITMAPDGRLFVSNGTNIMQVDLIALTSGKIILRELPGKFEKIKNLGSYLISFDQGGNLWLGNQSNPLLKVALDGNILSFTTASGLSMSYINSVFRDREGINWIATNNGGLNKLVHSNFSITEKPFGSSSPVQISYNENKNELLIYSIKDATAVAIKDNKAVYSYKVNNASVISNLTQTQFGFFGASSKSFYQMTLRNKTLFPEILLTDTTGNLSQEAIADKNGNLILCGNNLNVIIKGKTIVTEKLDFFADHAAMDSKGNIWVATRDQNLIMYETRPADEVHYFEKKQSYSKELSGFSPRSIIIDRNDNIWIGTRNNGIQVFYLQKGILSKLFSLTTASGLSDNFISHLSCDYDNNIWASSPSGLDKIMVNNGKPVIENITKQNSIYQTISKTIIDKDNTVWALVSNGLIRIAPEKKQSVNYVPTLLLSMVKAGKDTITSNSGVSLSHIQNNLDFHFAATSFLDEKQVLYSYQLTGSNNSFWSEPSNTASVSFIDLRPGNYSLNIKAVFPAGRYPEQTLKYNFSILPPWWQTWWSRIILGILTMGLIIIILKNYYHRKLEKQIMLLEKKQAIEKERTRIATDMHDDLGAGLSRIKFLSETIGIKKQQEQPIEEDIMRIREYSHEMIDKMGEIVWALNEKNDSLSDLLSYTRAYAVEYLSQNGINCIAEIPEHLPATFVSGEFRRNIYLTVKEALHNVVKHSQASEVIIRMAISHQLTIEIKDDGTGFDKLKIRPFSNGLSNMHSRIDEIGGVFEIINGHGTAIIIKAPIAG